MGGVGCTALVEAVRTALGEGVGYIALGQVVGYVALGEGNGNTEPYPYIFKVDTIQTGS